jgi:histidinol-phosphate aminotransferase
VPAEVPLRDLSIDLDAVLGKIDAATRMIFLCNPNNPTGTAFTRTELARFIEKVPAGIPVVVDEAYTEFVRDPECGSSLLAGRDVPGCLVTLRTFSKIYGLAGLRIGYGVMPPEIASLLHRIRQPFNAGTLAQVGAAAALADHDFYRETVRLIHSGLDQLYAALEKRGIRFFPTHANFFLVDLDRDADAVFRAMLERGIIVRSMAAYGYPTYIRINVGLPEENERFLKALDLIMGER